MSIIHVTLIERLLEDAVKNTDLHPFESRLSLVTSEALELTKGTEVFETALYKAKLYSDNVGSYFILENYGKLLNLKVLHISAKSTQLTIIKGVELDYDATVEDIDEFIMTQVTGQTVGGYESNSTLLPNGPRAVRLIEEFFSKNDETLVPSARESIDD